MIALAETRKRGAADKQKALESLRVALAAQCPRCRTQVTGDELLVLTEPASAREDPRIRRLRQGHCVQDGCPAQLYRLIFDNHPDLDWPALFSPGEPAAEQPQDEPELTSETEMASEAVPAKPLTRRQKVIRLGILAGIGLLLLMGRQCYFGGRIPLIREPEKFRVDPAPGGETQPR